MILFQRLTSESLEKFSKEQSIQNLLTLAITSNGKLLFDQFDQTSGEGVLVLSSEKNANGFRLDPAGGVYDRYQLNPVLLFNHDISLPPIGKCDWLTVKESGLRASFTYAPTPHAEQIQNLEKSGFMPGYSIGAQPLEFTEQKDHIYVSKWELFEISKVPLPADMYCV